MKLINGRSLIATLYLVVFSMLLFNMTGISKELYSVAIFILTTLFSISWCFDMELPHKKTSVLIMVTFSAIVLFLQLYLGPYQAFKYFLFVIFAAFITTFIRDMIFSGTKYLLASAAGTLCGTLVCIFITGWTCLLVLEAGNSFIKTCLIGLIGGGIFSIFNIKNFHFKTLAKLFRMTESTGKIDVSQLGTLSHKMFKMLFAAIGSIVFIVGGYFLQNQIPFTYSPSLITLVFALLVCLAIIFISYTNLYSGETYWNSLIMGIFPIAQLGLIIYIISILIVGW